MFNPTYIADNQHLEMQESMSADLTGAEITVRCLQEEGVEHIFGYPGGAVLFLYDELFKQDKVRHILVRHEQAAVHAAGVPRRSVDVSAPGTAQEHKRKKSPRWRAMGASRGLQAWSMPMARDSGSQKTLKPYAMPMER